MKKERMKELLDFEDLHVMVLGDVMLDEYLHGSTNRISPEAPVPVLNFEQRSHKLGGAANVALNLTNLEVETSLIGVIGDDDAGKHINRLCREEKNLSSLIIKDESRITTCKTRVLAKNQHLLRIDKENSTPVNLKIVQDVTRELSRVHEVRPIDIIIFQDYNKGFFSPEMIKAVMQWVNQNDVFSCLDPKIQNIDLFKGVQVFKPNHKELTAYLGAEIPIDSKGLSDASDKVLEKLSATWLTLTLSSDGIFIASKSDSHHELTETHSIIDVSGAGDTVLAISSLLIYLGKATLPEICKISNYAGAVVCNISGVGVVDKESLLLKAE